MGEPLEKRSTVTAELGRLFDQRFFTHRPLSDFTATKLGGPAEYLVIAETTEDLMAAGRVAAEYRLPLVVIGGGSGLLASDIGYPGLVVINRTDRIMFDTTTSQVVIDSGVMTDRLLNIAASKSLGGIEFLAAIPGTIGGAVATSAAYGNHQLKSSLKELMLFVPTGEGQIVTLTGAEIEAKTYERLFPATLAAPPIILTVRLQLARIDQPEILRRLLITRRERQRLIEGPRLGQVFTEPLATSGLSTNELNRLKGNGVRLESKDADIIIRASDKVLASDLKKFIGVIGELAESSGIHLDYRVHFLGYWPDEEEDSQASP